MLVAAAEVVGEDPQDLVVAATWEPTQVGMRYLAALPHREAAQW